MKFIDKLFIDERTKRFSVGLRDGVFAMYYAVGGAVIAAAIPALNQGRLPTTFEMKLAITVGISSGLQHIGRKFLTGPKQ